MAYVDALSAVEDLGDGFTWFKLAFDICDAETDRHLLCFRAMADSPLGVIGFEAQIPLLAWNNQELVDDLSVDWGRIVLRSIGAPTDTLVTLLEREFGLDKSSTTAVEKISCAAVLLSDDPAEMESAEMHAKLFFDSLAKADPESYAELYFNFDIKARRALLMEKDSSYRAPIVKWLRGTYRPADVKVH